MTEISKEEVVNPHNGYFYDLNIGNTSQISDDECKIISKPRHEDVDNGENNAVDADVGNSNDDVNLPAQLEVGGGGDTDQPLLQNIMYTHGGSDENPEQNTNRSVIDIHPRNNIHQENSFLNKRKWIILGLLVVIGFVAAVAIVVHLYRRHPQENNQLTSYAYALFQNSSWIFQFCYSSSHIKYDSKSDEFHINQNGVNIIHLQMHASNQTRIIEDGHIVDTCIRSSGIDVCQLISSGLPISIFLGTPSGGEQIVKIIEQTPIFSEDIVKSLIITSWPETKVLGLVRFHLDREKIRHTGTNNGQLPWIKVDEYGKTSIRYNSKWKLFDVNGPGTYLMLLSINTHVKSAANVSSKVQTCIRSEGETCRRFHLKCPKCGMFVPLTVVDIKRLSTEDKIDVIFYNMQKISITKDTRTLNSLTIVRFVQKVEFSLYHLNTMKRTSEILKWKEHAMVSKIFYLQHEILFLARETGVYWIYVCLTIQTMEYTPGTNADALVCIEFSEGPPYCQIIFIERRAVFPLTLTIVRHISSHHSFMIRLKQPNMLYENPDFNSLSVLKL